MFGVGVTPEERKQQAAIQRRQRLEAERKQRIFNPKQRLIGLDTDALKLQIEEKRRREEHERQLDEAYAQETNRQQMLYNELQSRIQNDRRRVFEDLQSFRKECQKYEDRREFELNDPKQLSYPARIHDDDARCGLSSMQKFEGEDLGDRRRLIEKAQQKNAWLEAQIREREQNRKEYEAVERLWEQQQREHSLRAIELATAEECARRTVQFETANYNLALANEAAEKRKLEKLADEEANLAHQLNMYNSELLTETTDVTHVNGPFRTTKTRFKGLTPEQVKIIKEEQLRQIMDNARRKESDRQYEESWSKMQRRFAVATTILDKELDDRRRDVKVETTHTNMELAREQRLRQEYLNRVLYRNSCSEDFFEQFNTSTR
ncbi:unnamed protein product [Orchesella dallaii]|uniref:RIB43A-like with coiled-coils protein 2 n=1 Tax=Orchesella dallaii TaxID=48710 RepID=A0ABP1S478_9HEXA